MNYFQTLQEVKPDPILGIAAKHRQDPREEKVNLSIGVYKSEESEIAVLKSVHEAEKILWEQKNNKGYPPVDGEASFRQEIIKLLSQGDLEYFYSAHTVGATSALRLSGEIMNVMGIKNVYYSDLTWPNHPQLFKEAGLTPIPFEYYDQHSHKLKIDKIYHTLENASPKSAILFQMTCHNPTGRDPSEKEWKNIVQIIKDKKLFPVLDCAYQGFGEGMEEDLLPFNLLKEAVDQMIVCYSCAKNFGLYGERVGAFIAYDKSKITLDRIAQNIKKIARCDYSTPPIHGARIVKTILQSPDLRQLWLRELKEMRERVKNLRQLFLKALQARNLPQNYEFILEDKGLFSLLAFSLEQIIHLRDEFAIYLLENGRINIAGLCKKNIDYVADAFKKVLEK